MGAVILDDRPVDEKGDLLWRRLPIRGELERIAETIVGAKGDGAAPSMTFAVHGKWGTGKSTALRMLRSFVAKKASEAAKAVVFCEFQAPSLQAARRDARSTLAMRILQAIKLSGDANAIAERFEDYARIVDKDRVSGLGGGNGQASAAVWDAAMLDRITGVLTSIPDLCSMIIRQELARRIMVVFLDDLDRCGAEFVIALLQEVQYLSDIENVFFVMAVDEDILRNAVRAQVSGETKSIAETDRELEKYVQHAVWVPALDAAMAKAYVKDLAAKVERVKDMIAPLEESGDGEAFELLLEGLQELTPRSVKRYLNLLAPKIDAAKATREVGSSDVMGNRAIFKEKMIEMTWPDFHRNILGRAIEARSSGEASSGQLSNEERLVLELQGLGRDARDKRWPDAKVNHDLQYVREEYPHLEIGEVSAKLVQYLRIMPVLPYTRAERPKISALPRGIEEKPSAMALELAGPRTRAAPQRRALPLSAMAPEQARGGDVGAWEELIKRILRLPSTRDGEAMEALRYVIERMHAGTRNELRSMAVVWYAELLQNHGYEGAAGDALHRAYGADRLDEGVRQRYSRFLLLANAPDLAREVEAGRPVSRKVTVPNTREVPGAFVAAGAERWWEEKEPGTLEPAP